MDQRLYGQFGVRIARYSGTLHGLGVLIADLEALWLHEEWKTQAKSEFRRQWEVLEQVHALALDRTPPAMTSEEKKEVTEALEEIQKVLPPPDAADS